MFMIGMCRATLGSPETGNWSLKTGVVTRAVHGRINYESIGNQWEETWIYRANAKVWLSVHSYLAHKHWLRHPISNAMMGAGKTSTAKNVVSNISINQPLSFMEW
jgi:hypothetical protein